MRGSISSRRGATLLRDCKLHLSVRRSPHVATALKPASATSLSTQLPERGENRPRKAAGCVFRRGRPQRTTRWRGCGQGCTRAGPREARIRITLFRWSGGRCSLDQLRCASFPVIWVEAMKRRSRAGGEPAKARPRKALKRKGGSAPKVVSLGRSSLGQTEAARLTRERDEALTQQAATADLLKVIRTYLKIV
jgi:hypothetical protein